MTEIRVTPIPTALVRALQAGGLDAHGNRPERAVSDGAGAPCRHCLSMIPEGAGMLILAHSPFGARQPYAETGPVFLCAEPCAPWQGEGLPPILTSSPDYMLRGYDAAERIVYGTGAVVPAATLAERAAALLDDGAITFVHVRSARNGCFHCRIDRAGAA